jgi:hypothetical protein
MKFTVSISDFPLAGPEMVGNLVLPIQERNPHSISHFQFSNVLKTLLDQFIWKKIFLVA